MRTDRLISVAMAVLVAAACGSDQRDVVGPAPSGQLLAAEVSVPPNYGIHDTYVRDGLAFVCAWNSGIIILDVGNGMAGGSPASPVEIATLLTNTNGLAGAHAHNAWWFHNPNTGERRYLFVGQEGPGQLGFSSSGDIHVIDVTDLAMPVEVASYTMTGTAQPAGAHNFWMDEDAEVLFAAFYNGGVVALDVSGTLAGDLSGREIARVQPAADSTYVWGVQYANGSVYITDMLSGLYQLTFTGSTFTRAGGGTGVGTERFFSDLWVTADYAYTGSWGTRGQSSGNVVHIWRLNDLGSPSIVRQYEIDGIGTVGDVEVSPDGRVLLVSAERGPEAGLLLFDVRDPERPEPVSRTTIPQGVHTATFAVIDGTLYAFAARNPPQPALLIFEIVE